MAEIPNAKTKKATNIDTYLEQATSFFNAFNGSVSKKETLYNLANALENIIKALKEMRKLMDKNP